MSRQPTDYLGHTISAPTVQTVSFGNGTVVIHADGTVKIKDGVTLDEASIAFWAVVSKLMQRKAQPQPPNVVEVLKELAGLFDVGCSVHMGEDEITVEGNDYLEGDTKTDGSVFVIRLFAADYELIEGGDGWKDTITPLIEKIRAERAEPKPEPSAPPAPPPVGQSFRTSVNNAESLLGWPPRGI